MFFVMLYQAQRVHTKHAIVIQIMSAHNILNVLGYYAINTQLFSLNNVVLSTRTESLTK